MKVTLKKAAEICGISIRPRKKGSLRQAIRFAVGKIVDARRKQDDESAKLFSQCKSLLTSALKRICHCEICGVRCSEGAKRCAMHIKYKPQLFLCVCLLVVTAVAGPVKNTALLTWTYPSDEIGAVTFNVYSSTNINTPTSNWPLVTTSVTTNVIVSIFPGNMFWFVTASNEFGESIPSNTATSTVARQIQGTKVK